MQDSVSRALAHLLYAVSCTTLTSSSIFKLPQGFPAGYCNYEETDLDVVLLCHYRGTKASFIDPFIWEQINKATRDYYSKHCIKASNAACLNSYTCKKSASVFLILVSVLQAHSVPIGFELLFALYFKGIGLAAVS